MKNFRQDFIKFTEMIRNNKHFGFARYSDGELSILENKELKLSADVIQVGETKSPGVYQAPDFKHYNPSEHIEFRNKLIEAYQHKQSNYYKGISCKCCVGDDAFKFQLDLHGGDDDSLTWAKNHVFLFSASTFTNLAVYELFRDFPDNSYIDIGTCLTPMMNMPTHRGYLQAFWGYRGGQDIQKICIW